MQSKKGGHRENNASFCRENELKEGKRRALGKRLAAAGREMMEARSRRGTMRAERRNLVLGV